MAKRKTNWNYKYNAVTACLFSLSVQTGLQSNSCSMKWTIMFTEPDSPFCEFWPRNTQIQIHDSPFCELWPRNTQIQIHDSPFCELWPRNTQLQRGAINTFRHLSGFHWSAEEYWGCFRSERLARRVNNNVRITPWQPGVSN